MFYRSGVHALVDGQYGSTGKGLLASWIAHNSGPRPFDIVVSNAGPNSGHTFYHDGERHVLKQLPTMAVAQKLAGIGAPSVYLSAGAVIDMEILLAEVEKYDVQVQISPQAAVISAEDRADECSGTIGAVAGTRQGVGAALARKVRRDPSAVIHDDLYMRMARAGGIRITDTIPGWRGNRVFMEVSQGFSLGLNSQFYPKVTSRECTVMQGLADARIPPRQVVSTSMAIRTFPIRVGNVDGHSSGDWYSDQQEIDWDSLKVEPERTTVTNRMRRVATFSKQQFIDALLANMPTLVFVNFMNYLTSETRRTQFANQLSEIARATLGYKPDFLYGFGPRVEDVVRDPLGRSTGGAVAPGGTALPA